MKNRKLLKLKRNYFFYSNIPGIPINLFCNSRNFVIKFYIKICLVIIIIFLFSSDKKLEKKTEQEQFITQEILRITPLAWLLMKKKTCKKIQSQTEINGPYFYFTFLKTRGRHRIGKKIPNLQYKLDKFHFWRSETVDESSFNSIIVQMSENRDSSNRQ